MSMEKTLRDCMSAIKNYMARDPEYTRAFVNLLESIMKTRTLDRKTKELIAVALSVQARCEYCIAFHVKNALEAGASREEINEAAWVAVTMCGGPCFMYKQLVDRALEEIK